ncbi:MAG: tellurite resistance TerB family protein [Scytonematopsis contorta HA4267-MV1]|nr:tellurite resistance TerB family protein [Scytonematopsis contorta HA4267-MV1]
MGLFDKIFSVNSSVQEALTPAEAFAAITIAAIASDGYLSDKEARSLCATLSRMKLFKNYTDDAIASMFDMLLNTIRREGMNFVFNTAKDSLNPDMREAAFAVAADLVLADGMLAQEERDFLNDLYQSLGISSDTAKQVMDVMSIKNRG